MVLQNFSAVGQASPSIEKHTAKFAAISRSKGFTALSKPTATGWAVIFIKGSGHKPVSVRLVVREYKAFRKTNPVKGVQIFVEDVPGRSAVAFRIKKR